MIALAQSVPVTPATLRRPPGPRPARLPVLVFEVAGQQYGLALRDVLEIVPMARLACAPCQPSVIDGFLNLAGVAVPVLRLDRLFRLREQPAGLYTPLLILRNTLPTLALRVAKVNRIVRLNEADVVPVLEDHSFNGSVEGVATVDGAAIVLLAPDRLLLEKEQHYLAEFQDREQERLRELAEALP